ncbi:type II toxin-antitoxin system prevent-host-death family antitoxin [Mycobacterium vicinigordonae]|uniref:Type II toxin-antitoxin system prevent-host-death family antitoxin n=1 Tax=Mycobacterium vicinigordonae TaxID=1719132 RepID=A0A7D6DUM9_9MYCO|nr:type II toxin-antitoxin system prevent-host-death family antitoxin [Mycobacterium vicinigordonae]QLL05204.1 type II toxin-antitoxin system prevent-host-death family antitoxin [Mycobacterium vicinigordonae]
MVLLRMVWRTSPQERSEMPEVIGLGQLRSDACTYLDRVRAGEAFDVIRRGRLVASIVPVGERRVAPIPTQSTAAANRGGWVRLAELRTRAGQCFDRVAGGETLYVVRGGKILAQIKPAGDAPQQPVPADAGGRVALHELRSRPGRYLDQVAAGQSIEVSRGGKVVARIVSVA